MAGGLWSSQAILAMKELTDSQQQDLTAFLQLVGCRVQGERPGPKDEVSNQKLFATAYFLVSALAGMETKTKKNRATSAMAGKWYCFLYVLLGHRSNDDQRCFLSFSVLRVRVEGQWSPACVSVLLREDYLLVPSPKVLFKYSL